MIKRNRFFLYFINKHQKYLTVKYINNKSKTLFSIEEVENILSNSKSVQKNIRLI